MLHRPTLGLRARHTSLALGWAAAAGCADRDDRLLKLSPDTADTGIAEDSGQVDLPGDGGEGGGDEGGALDTGEGAPEPLPCETTGGLLPRGLEGAPLDLEASLSGARPACAAAWHAAAAAEGMELSLRLDAAEDGAMWVEITDLLGAPLAELTRLSPGEALGFRATQSGELFVTLHPVSPGEAADPPRSYSLSLRCAGGCDREFTRYPIVFMHGMAGTDSYLSALDYWFGLDRAYDETTFAYRTPAVDALAGTAPRAAQWRAHLDALKAEGLGRRFNLVAHSQGGIDARLLIATLDPSADVASLTTISTPHRGTPIADLADGALDLTPFDGWLIDASLDALAGLVGLSGPSLSDQMHDMTRAQMAEFNATVPDRPDVQYWSWAGVSCGALDWGCRRARDGEVVELVFEASLAIVSIVEGDNDGLVGAESAHWGEFLGEINADHMDEVGQIADLYNPPFNAGDFYLNEARRLAAAGL